MGLEFKVALNQSSNWILKQQRSWYEKVKEFQGKVQAKLDILSEVSVTDRGEGPGKPGTPLLFGQKIAGKAKTAPCKPPCKTPVQCQDQILSFILLLIRELIVSEIQVELNLSIYAFLALDFCKLS